MCLIVKKKFHSYIDAHNYKPLIAKNDIKVYKILEYCKNDKNDNVISGLSPYQGFKYKKGIHYTESKFIIQITPNLNKISIFNGLHACKTKNSKFISNFKNLFGTSFELIEMYIPKGSKYYLGTENDIVTNNLIWY